VWPFIIDQRLVHLTPLMFPCHRSHSWISMETIFLVKNLKVLAFGIIEMVVHGYFQQKWGLCGRWSLTRGSFTSPPICFLAKDHILGFLVRPFLGPKSVGVSLRYYWKWSFMLFLKNRGCVAFHHRPEARTPHPHMFPYRGSHSWISGGDHFLVKNPRC
jgi:hypothetical protein